MGFENSAFAPRSAGEEQEEWGTEQLYVEGMEDRKFCFDPSDLEWGWDTSLAVHWVFEKAGFHPGVGGEGSENGRVEENEWISEWMNEWIKCGSR